VHDELVQDVGIRFEILMCVLRALAEERTHHPAKVAGEGGVQGWLAVEQGEEVAHKFIVTDEHTQNVVKLAAKDLAGCERVPEVAIWEVIRSGCTYIQSIGVQLQ
jgi:hypothetical protein